MNTFDPENHRYSMSGVDVPGVTEVLPPVEFFCTPEQLEAARQDGIQQHAKLNFYIASGMNPFDDPDMIQIDKLIKDNIKYLGDPVINEECLFSKKHRFAGKPDILFTKAVLDLKRTLSSKKRTAAQCSGYKILGVENKIISPTKKYYVIHRVNGVWKMVNVYNDQADNIFLVCVKRWHMEKSIQNYFK